MRRRRRLLKISSLVTYSCLASQSQFLYSLSINQILNLNWAIWAMWAAQGSKEKKLYFRGWFSLAKSFSFLFRYFSVCTKSRMKLNTLRSYNAA